MKLILSFHLREQLSRCVFESILYPHWFAMLSLIQNPWPLWRWGSKPGLYSSMTPSISRSVLLPPFKDGIRLVLCVHVWLDMCRACLYVWRWKVKGVHTLLLLCGSRGWNSTLEPSFPASWLLLLFPHFTLSAISMLLLLKRVPLCLSCYRLWPAFLPMFYKDSYKD